MSQPTHEQLEVYVNELPDIYKIVLSAYADQRFERRYGEPLSHDELRQAVIYENDYYRFSDVDLALKKLVQKGLLIENDLGDPPFVLTRFTPTQIGEMVIETLSGKKTVRSVVPDLPEFSWK